MGKKKEYNLSEIDTKQAQDNDTNRKEFFTVQEYEAIVNDGSIDQTDKPSESGDQDEVENDSSSGNDQTKGEEENEPIQTQTDCKGDENVNHQPTTGSMDDHIDNTDNTETSKKQIPTSKTEEEYTTIDLEETKHAPDPSKEKPVMLWLRKNFCLIVGVSFVIALIAVISIAATSRKEPSVEREDLMARKANPAGFKPATEENSNDIGYNSKVEITTSPFQSTESRPTKSDIGNTSWATVHDPETSYDDDSTIEIVTDDTESVSVNVNVNVNDYDYDYDYVGSVNNLSN